VRLVRVCSVITLSTVLLLAALDKVLHWPLFLVSLEGYGVRPPYLRALFAALVVGIELFTSITLLWPALRRHALVLVASLFAVFALAVVYLMLVAPDSPCGCIFTVGSWKADLNHLVLNLVLGALALFLAVQEKREERTHSVQRENGGILSGPPFIPFISRRRIP